MPKLEEKLLELGYKYSSCTENCGLRYGKWSDESKTYKIIFVINYPDKNQILEWYVYPHLTFYRNQQNIDNLQQAFNQLEKDLEILKERGGTR